MFCVSVFDTSTAEKAADSDAVPLSLPSMLQLRPLSKADTFVVTDSSKSEHAVHERVHTDSLWTPCLLYLYVSIAPFEVLVSVCLPGGRGV